MSWGLHLSSKLNLERSSQGREGCDLRGPGRMWYELGFGGYTGFACMGKSQDANQGRLRLPCYIPVSIREPSIGSNTVDGEVDCRQAMRGCVVN